MRPEDYVTHLRRDGARLADVAEGNLARPVPSCPEWNVADLLWHTGEVHRFWANVVATLSREPRGLGIERPADDSIVAWYREGVEVTARTLEAADPTAALWTWTSTDDTAAWVQRRMAQETAVHRYDGELACERTTLVDQALALDGIDEFLDVFLPEADTTRDLGKGTIHLHATDDKGEWLLTVDGADTRVERGHAKGDVAVRGSASDLLLMLWRRVPPVGLEVLGDAPVLDRFLAGVAIE
jgi:uncharacterized protein (TIGR03083 family)